MNHSIEDYINYRLERAGESVEEAQLLAGNNNLFIDSNIAIA